MKSNKKSTAAGKTVKKGRCPYSRERREKYITLTIEVTRGLSKSIREAAKKEERTVSAWLRGRIKQFLEN